jgi:hypothetical protein
MRRISWIAVAPLLSFAVLAGCAGDTTVSPVKAPSATAAAPVRFAPQGHPTLDLSGGATDSTAIEFSVGSSGGIFFLGKNAVVFPERSICDPATSGYGAEAWDKPCATIQAPIRVHAEIRHRDGKSWVDFTPALRFAPSTNPNRWVWMVMAAPAAVGASGDLSRFNILYASTIGGATVDETVFDATMRTYVDTRAGVSYRRIGHFSGYAAAEGKCDTDCSGGGSTPP